MFCATESPAPGSDTQDIQSETGSCEEIEPKLILADSSIVGKLRE